MVFVRHKFREDYVNENLWKRKRMGIGFDRMSSESRPRWARVSIKLEAPVYEMLVSVQEKLEFVHRRKFSKSEVIDLLMAWGEEKMKRIDELNRELEKLAQPHRP